jgi:hypothetical protein
MYRHCSWGFYAILHSKGVPTRRKTETVAFDTFYDRFIEIAALTLCS